MSRIAWHRPAGPIAAVLLAGCMVVPVTRDTYDAECRTLRREIVLETAVLSTAYGCAGDQCAVLLATMGVVAAASVVVSGSIAIVGNAIYWLEYQGNCRPEEAEKR